MTKTNNQSYFSARSLEANKRMNKILDELPDFVTDFFISIENNTSDLTRLNYAYDLRVFFDYLMCDTPLFADVFDLKKMTAADLNRVRANHIERYLSFVSHYESDDGRTKNNTERGKARKLASVRALFRYLYRHNLLNEDVSSKVSSPKMHDKSIIRLEQDEMVKFLNTTETGYGLDGHAKSYHEHTKVRDVAIVTLLLGTGMRISECVGLNLSDVDFSINALKITRKGGNQTILYFSDEVKVALIDWLNERASNPMLVDEPALFTSLQNRRITPRAVQNLVKKYAEISTPLKHITPHKLRSTYGTNLYRETGDIYIVADVLGHKDVNTTKKHYAAISEDLRKDVADKVKLRPD
jgi:site-specific recombinase XerD